MSKNRIITLFAMIGALTTCGLFTHGASAQNKPDPKDVAAAKQIEDAYQLINDATKRQREQYQKKLEEDSDRGRRVDALLARWEEQTARQEKVAERYAKILDTWEKQQQQMQKLLDSMAAKK